MRGNYALHVAALSGQSEQAELLLLYGASPREVDDQGNTAAVVARCVFLGPG